MKLEMGSLSLKKTLNSRETVMLVATLLVLFLGYYKSCAMPAQGKLAKVRDDISLQIEEKDRLLRQITLKKSEIQVKEPKERQWLSKRESIESSIKSVVNPVHIVSVKITDFSSTDSKEKESPFPKRKIALVAHGEMKELGHFIEYIENLEAPLVVESLSIAPDGNSPGNLILKIEGGFYVAP